MMTGGIIQLYRTHHAIPYHQCYYVSIDSSHYIFMLHSGNERGVIMHYSREGPGNSKVAAEQSADEMILPMVKL